MLGLRELLEPFLRLLQLVSKDLDDFALMLRVYWDTNIKWDPPPVVRVR